MDSDQPAQELYRCRNGGSLLRLQCRRSSPSLPTADVTRDEFGQRSRRTSAVMAALRMRGEGPTGYEPAAGLSGDEFRARIIEPHKQRYSSRRSGASSL